MREWLRLQGNAGVDVLELSRNPPGFLRSFWQRWRNTRAARQQVPDFSHEVYEAMAGCLSCKACAGQCPIKVNVPDFRARFLQLYHQRYLRPLRHYLIGSLEFSMPWFARVPWLYNGIMGNGWVQRMMEKHVGMVDSPLINRMALEPVLQQWQVDTATPAALAALSAEERARSVILVQDSFTRYFETEQLADFIELAARLGLRVWLAPLHANGKPLQVQGFLPAFERVARRHIRALQALARFDIPLVGLDPAMTLVFRQEYAKIEGIQDLPRVLLPQEWLLKLFENEASRAMVEGALPAATAETVSEAGAKQRPAVAKATLDGHRGAAAAPQSYRLLAHCTEKTNEPNSSAQWVKVFGHFGLKLQVQATGCCGMSGTYGHEARNAATSRTIYSQSWQAHVERPADEAGEALATGYSCRSQVKRMTQRKLRHPLQVLLERVRQS